MKVGHEEYLMSLSMQGTCQECLVINRIKCHKDFVNKLLHLLSRDISLVSDYYQCFVLCTISLHMTLLLGCDEVIVVACLYHSSQRVGHLV